MELKLSVTIEPVLRRRSAAMAKPNAVRQRAMTKMWTSIELLSVSPISPLGSRRTCSPDSLAPQSYRKEPSRRDQSAVMADDGGGDDDDHAAAMNGGA